MSVALIPWFLFLLAFPLIGSILALINKPPVRNAALIINAIFGVVYSLFTLSYFRLVNNVVALKTIVPIEFFIDSWGARFIALTSILWFLLLIYDVFTSTKKNAISTGSISTFAIFSVILSKNIVTMYLFYLMLMFVMFLEQDSKKYLKYIILRILVFFTLVLPVITILGFIYNGSSFTDGGYVIYNKNRFLLAIMFMTLIISGICSSFINACFIPRVSLGYFSLIIGAEIMCIFKITKYVFGLSNVSEILGGGSGNVLFYLTIFLTVAFYVCAIMQKDLRKRILYSILGDAAQCIIYLSQFNYGSFKVGFICMISFIVTKTGLLLCLRHIQKADNAKGLWHTMPITASCIAFGGLSAIGIPFTIGFANRMFLIQSHGYLMQVAFITTDILHGLCFAPIIYDLFIKFNGERSTTDRHENHRFAILPIVFVAILNIALSYYIMSYRT